MFRWPRCAPKCIIYSPNKRGNKKKNAECGGVRYQPSGVSLTRSAAIKRISSCYDTRALSYSVQRSRDASLTPARPVLLGVVDVFSFYEFSFLK